MGPLSRAYHALEWRCCRLIRRIPPASLVRMRSRALFDWMNRNAVGKTVLNLGSGLGNYDHLLDPQLRMINLDLDPTRPGLHCVGDAQQLPFADETFDVVYSIAVLEHVRKPWLAAAEICRVLKPGGHVALELPFLNLIHGEHDFFRFTDMGIRSLFDEDRFDVVFEQVGGGGGSHLAQFLTVYPLQFLPLELLRHAWFRVMSYPFSLCKYLDLINLSAAGCRRASEPFNHAEMRTTACSFSFIARKRRDA